MRRAGVGWRATILVLVGSFAAAVACSGGSSQARHTTVPTATTPTTSADPYAIPATIDAAYVNRVLAALDAAVGDIVRMIVRARVMSPEAMDRLRSLYGDSALPLQIQGLAADAKDSFAGVRDNPGNQRSSVTQLIKATPTCVFARVARDYTPIATNPDPALSDQWIGLKPLAAGRDPQHYNPTLWMYVYDGFPRDHSQPADPCGVSS